LTQSQHFVNSLEQFASELSAES